MTDGNSAEWIAGFWRRIGAFAIDIIILGIIGIGLGLFLEKQLAQLGGWGRLVGFFVALVYFGIFNSRIFGGQTVGKRIVSIRVVDGNNQSIDLFRSFARYSILGGPFFLIGAQFTNEAMTSVWSYLIYPVIVGGLLSVVYLYIFNRVTRQSLHDLALDTYVVDAHSERIGIGTFWRPHLIIVGGLFLGSALLSIFTSSLAQNEPFKDLLIARTALIEHPSVTYVSVSSSTSTWPSTSDEIETTTHLSARAFLNNDTVSNVELAEQLAMILAHSHSNAQQMDVIQIVLTYGYDIGIWSSWSYHSHVFSPKDLMDEN